MTALDSVQVTFITLSSCLSNDKKRPPIKRKYKFGEKDHIQLYAYYKQAINGKCETPSSAQPSESSFEGKKHKAWASLRDMTRDAAMGEYVKLVSKSYPKLVNSVQQDVGSILAKIDSSCKSDEESVASELSSPANKVEKTISEPTTSDPEPIKAESSGPNTIELFDMAVEFIQTSDSSDGSNSFSKEQMLKVYGLYKQATIGACNTSRPGVFEVTKRLKWDAWTELGGMSKEEAREKYVELVKSMGWKPDMSAKATKTASPQKSSVDSTATDVPSMPLSDVMESSEIVKKTNNEWITFMVVLVYFTLIPISAGLAYFFFTFSTVTKYAVLVYFGYILADSTPSSGGRARKWFKRSIVWHYFRDYFPVEMTRTVALDPSKNYIFGYHPHGIISVGALINFATDATGFSKMFPGINLHVLTLVMNLNIPFFREVMLSFGMADASRESCNYCLSKQPGESILLVLGGAQESLDAHPGVFHLTLKKRKGFVKVGLRNGASLVPVVSFGENDLFVQVPNERGSALRDIQDKLLKVLGFATPLATGRFHMPLKRPIRSIVGAPIDLPVIDAPTQEEIDKYHTMYVDSLKKLYDEYKETCAPTRRESFRIS